MKKRIMKTIGTNMMTKLKLLTALLLLASGCANNESQDEIDELNSNLQKEITGCYIDLNNTELAIESCLYELDETERRLAQCKENKR